MPLVSQVGCGHFAISQAVLCCVCCEGVICVYEGQGGRTGHQAERTPPPPFTPLLCPETYNRSTPLTILVHVPRAVTHPGRVRRGLTRWPCGGAALLACIYCGIDRHRPMSRDIPEGGKGCGVRRLPTRGTSNSAQTQPQLKLDIQFLRNRQAQNQPSSRWYRTADGTGLREADGGAATHLYSSEP